MPGVAGEGGIVVFDLDAAGAAAWGRVPAHSKVPPTRVCDTSRYGPAPSSVYGPLQPIVTALPRRYRHLDFLHLLSDAHRIQTRDYPRIPVRCPASPHTAVMSRSPSLVRLICRARGPRRFVESPCRPD